MVCEHEITKIGTKNFLVINCLHCANNSSLGNITCFRRIFQKIKEVDGIDNMIFQRSYKKVFDENSFKLLKEYITTVGQIPEPPKLCDEDFEKNSILKFKLEEDPIGAVLHLMGIKPCSYDKAYFEKVRKLFEKTEIWTWVDKYKDKYSESELYHIIFRDKIFPGFISYYTDPIPKDAEIIEKYQIGGSDVRLYRTPGKPYPVYHITPHELNLTKNELMILNKAFAKLSKKEFDLKRADAICEKLVDEVAPELTAEKKKELAQTLKRYSFGYGIVEVLFQDPKLQDIYIDSPGDKHVYVYHEEYEECVTNIILAPEELEKLSTRFRMLSGRPFDESYPVLHAELKDKGVRIAGVTEPITFAGTGFAFRKHAVQPWTLQHFIKNKMLTAEAAGLISFLIDGQKSFLITGPRSSGKTSFLGSLITEIPQNYRIITIEDTPELPIEKLRDIGFNIQHLRIRSTLQREAYEVTADEALRNALRLGESVLILGEVRGEEAKALFEAMRIGAAGNVVMGTVHGSSAYDVWDRIVNDLKVPSTSFKAADIIINCAPMREGENLKRNRRILGITEVLKYWVSDPHAEKGFLELMHYNRSKDRLELSKNIRKSPAIKSIISKKGITIGDAMRSIKTRAKIKEAIVKASKKNPALLNIKFAMFSVNKFIELISKYKRKVNYGKLLREFKTWLKIEQKTFGG